MAEVVWHPYEGTFTRHTTPEMKRLLEWTTVKISRGDLERLDKVITFVDAMAELFSPDFYDDLWNMRNHMLPFQPGDEHYDEEIGNG